MKIVHSRCCMCRWLPWADFYWSCVSHFRGPDSENGWSGGNRLSLFVCSLGAHARSGGYVAAVAGRDRRVHGRGPRHARPPRPPHLRPPPLPPQGVCARARVYCTTPCVISYCIILYCAVLYYCQNADPDGAGAGHRAGAQLFVNNYYII